MKTTLALATLLTLALPQPGRAQGVLVAPHAVFLDHRTRSGTLTLYNPGREAVEISIETLFGYPVSDSAGHLTLYAPETPDSTEPSAAGWLQAFPRRMTLAPQERQTVRLLGRPPASLPDGEYWSRLAVSAKGGTVPVSGVVDTSQIKVGLTLEIRTILPVYYRKGNPTTGLAIDGVHTMVEGDSLVVRPRLVRQGNAAFVGTLRGALADSAGTVRSSFSMPLAVFYRMEPRVTTSRAGIPAGRYLLRLELASERDDLPEAQLLPIAPVRDSLEVVLP